MTYNVNHKLMIKIIVGDLFIILLRSRVGGRHDQGQTKPPAGAQGDPEKTKVKLHLLTFHSLLYLVDGQEEETAQGLRRFIDDCWAVNPKHGGALEELPEAQRDVLLLRCTKIAELER